MLEIGSGPDGHLDVRKPLGLILLARFDGTTLAIINDTHFERDWSAAETVG